MGMPGISPGSGGNIYNRFDLQLNTPSEQASQDLDHFRAAVNTFANSPTQENRQAMIEALDKVEAQRGNLNTSQQNALDMAQPVVEADHDPTSDSFQIALSEFNEAFS